MIKLKLIILAFIGSILNAGIFAQNMPYFIYLTYVDTGPDSWKKTA